MVLTDFDGNDHRLLFSRKLITGVEILSYILDDSIIPEYEPFMKVVNKQNGETVTRTTLLWAGEDHLFPPCKLGVDYLLFFDRPAIAA